MNQSLDICIPKSNKPFPKTKISVTEYCVKKYVHLILNLLNGSKDSFVCPPTPSAAMKTVHKISTNKGI